MDITRRIAIIPTAAGLAVALFAFAQAVASQPPLNEDTAAEIAALEAALEHSTNLEKNLLEQIRELKETQSRLSAQLDRQSAPERASPASTSPASTSPTSTSPTSTSPASTSSSHPTATPPEAPATDVSPDWLIGGIFALFTLVLTVVLLSHQRRKEKTRVELAPTALSDTSFSPQADSAADAISGTDIAVSIPDPRPIAAFPPESHVQGHDPAIEAAAILERQSGLHTGAFAPSPFSSSSSDGRPMGADRAG
jgi:hypothetical protein